MLLATPGADLLGPNTALVLSTLPRHGRSMPLSQLRYSTKITRESLSRLLLDLVSIGIVTETAHGRNRSYQIETHHLAWPGLALIIDARRTVIDYVRHRAETLAPASTILALPLPGGDQAKHGADFVAIHDDKTDPAELDLMRNALESEVPMLAGGTTSVKVLSMEQLKERIAGNDGVVTGWGNSLTIYGDNLSQIIRSLKPSETDTAESK